MTKKKGLRGKSSSKVRTTMDPEQRGKRSGQPNRRRYKRYPYVEIATQPEKVLAPVQYEEDDSEKSKSKSKRTTSK